MKASVILCDAAQAADGKLYILGGGWALTGPDPANFAVALDVKAPWSDAHARHTWRLDLIDADGNVADLGDGPVTLGGEFRVSPVIDSQPGMTLSWIFAVNFAAVPLAPGTQYQWSLWIDDEHGEDWYADFWTRPERQAQTG